MSELVRNFFGGFSSVGALLMPRRREPLPDNPLMFDLQMLRSDIQVVSVEMSKGSRKVLDEYQKQRSHSSSRK